MKKKLSALLFSTLVGCIFSSTATANVTFSDNTFNLSDYSVSKYQTGVADVAVVSQTLTGGNPGAAMQSIINNPAAGGSPFYATQYLSNTTFQYDPSLHGAVGSIDAAADLYIDGTAGGVHVPFNVFGVMSIMQGENIYVYSQQVPFVPADFTPIKAFGLTAADFSLVTDPKNIFAVDPTNHPNFSSGLLEFGVVTFAYSPAGFPVLTAVERFDNLSFTISAVPEPETYAMLLAGLGLVGFITRRKNQLKNSVRLS